MYKPEILMQIRNEHNEIHQKVRDVANASRATVSRWCREELTDGKVTSLQLLSVYKVIEEHFQGLHGPDFSVLKEENSIEEEKINILTAK